MKERVLAYLAKCPPAISGQGGHTQTLKVAYYLSHGFALSDQETLSFLEEYNRRCQPPWSRKELLHKISSAKKNVLGKVRGYLLKNNSLLPPRNKHKHPGIGCPIPGMAPFKSGLGDGSDTSFPVSGKNNSEYEDNIIYGTEKQPSGPSYLSQSDETDQTVERKEVPEVRPRTPKKRAFSHEDFQAANERALETVPAGYDPVSWVRHGRAMPLKTRSKANRESH